MKTFKKVEITEEHLEKIQCDSCNLVALKSSGQYEFQEFISIRISGGYGSIFGDCTIWECDLCQNCAKKILGRYLRKVADF